MDDSQIIELFFGRSEQAISELSRKYGRICKKLSENILSNESDAEECVNDAYLGIWNRIPPERPDRLLAYVCRVVRNLSIKKYHANTAGKRNSFYNIAMEELGECLSLPDTAASELNARELTARINTFLNTLDRKNRVMFVRRYWFSDSIAEIAAAFEMTEHSVSVRLYRTRKKMRNYLETEGIVI